MALHRSYPPYDTHAMLPANLFAGSVWQPAGSPDSSRSDSEHGDEYGEDEVQRLRRALAESRRLCAEHS